MMSVLLWCRMVMVWEIVCGGGDEGIWEISVLSTQFCYETALKIKCINKNSIKNIASNGQLNKTSI